MEAPTVLKRHRHEVNEARRAIETIVLSDDSEDSPPAKRRKSSTPHDDEHAQKPTSSTSPIYLKQTESSSIDFYTKQKRAIDVPSPRLKHSVLDHEQTLRAGRLGHNTHQRSFTTDKLSSITNGLSSTINRTFKPTIGPLLVDQGMKFHTSSPAPIKFSVESRGGTHAPSQKVPRFNEFKPGGLRVSESRDSGILGARDAEAPTWPAKRPYHDQIKTQSYTNHATSPFTVEKSNSHILHGPNGSPRFSVEIPSRPNTAGPSQLPNGSNFSHIEVIVPSSAELLEKFKGQSAAEHKAARHDLLKRMKSLTFHIEDNVDDIDKYFGITGFSKQYNTEQDQDKLKRAAPSRKRTVDRANVKLQWAAEPRSNAIANTRSPDPKSSTKIPVHPREQAKGVLAGRFSTNFNPPLTFANDVNDRWLNGKFQFVNHYILGHGVRTAPMNTNIGCECVGNCVPNQCQCLAKDIGNKQFEQVETYSTRSDGLVVLSKRFIENELRPDTRHFEISECNERCGCGPTCWNRVVGRGRTLPLEIFETKMCGFGVRSPQTIFRGQFIELYLGEVITQQELERREEAKEENAASYVYSLDWFQAQHCHHVDGENYGTAMRFVNHSCSPNARGFTVQTHKNDKHVYYQAFFAISDIPPGVEITIDYSPQEEGNVNELSSDEEGRALCFCGAPNCRKVLWRNAAPKRRRKKLAYD